MDLYSVAQTLWRHKKVTLPIALLTLIGCFGVIAVQKPTYQSSSTYILTSPPPAPTAAQIARDPALASVNANNPYVNYGDLSIVADLVTKVVTAPLAQARLIAAGADPRYQAVPSPEFGNTTPIIDVTGVASTPAGATRTAQLVGAALSSTLKTMQAAQGVDPRYWIGTIEVTPPSAAQIQLSSKLRELIGVLALGLILIFIAVSVMSGIEARHTRRQGAKAEAEAQPQNAARVTRAVAGGRSGHLGVSPTRKVSSRGK